MKSNDFCDFTRPIGPPKGSVLVSGNGTPKISGKSRLVKYYSIWPDCIFFTQIPWSLGMPSQNNDTKVDEESSSFDQLELDGKTL